MSPKIGITEEILAKFNPRWSGRIQLLYRKIGVGAILPPQSHQLLANLLPLG